MMRSATAAIALLSATAPAHGLLTSSSSSSCPYSAICSVGGLEGVCVSKSSGCCAGGTFTAGLCPGSSDIQCCTAPSCSAPAGAGVCKQTSACSGTAYAGYCSGPSEIQCCVGQGPDSNTTFGENPFYYNNWCNTESYSLPYLDDKYCQKKFPSSFNREWSCPVQYDSVPAGFQPDASLSSVSVDTTTLPNFITNGVNLCLIVTRRVSGKMYHKYFCNGEISSSEPHETWSSSKIFAIANAAGHLREECAAAGTDASTTGKHGTTPLGDLATIVCSYDHTQGYSSNSLSSYFHDLGWRQRLDELVAGPWLNRPNETLGGNYGEASPSDLGFSLSCADGSSCAAAKDPWPIKYSNTISTLSAAELTRRLVQHRDVPSDLRFPGVQWSDVKSVLYGAETSALFPSLQWGGMTADTAVYVQTALDMPKVEEDARGQWRIFSKLGAGYSSSRLVGEILDNAYACLPVLGSDGKPVLNAGWEFTLNVRGSIPGDSSLSKVDSAVAQATHEALNALLQGKLV